MDEDFVDEALAEKILAQLGSGGVIRIGEEQHPFANYHDASYLYREYIDQNDLSSPMAPKCKIQDASGVTVAFISYNGVVWAGERYTSSAVRIHWGADHDRPRMNERHERMWQMMERSGTPPRSR